MLKLFKLNATEDSSLCNLTPIKFNECERQIASGDIDDAYASTSAEQWNSLWLRQAWNDAEEQNRFSFSFVEVCQFSFR